MKSPLRVAQLDLARQMETIYKIKEFIDFIANNGYNCLLLYLEWRVKTKSLPCVPDNESYTPEQMREIIYHAKSRNIEIIPGLACLGHAEMLLQYPEFEGLAELRGKVTGRHGNNLKQVFCTSQKATWNFLENYLNEICEIFPSQYVHIGLDEAWDIGYCEECAIKIKDFHDEQQLFLTTIKFCHSVITGSFKRRVMMWDDMFEYYQEILPDVPRDIIMVCWQYQNDVRFIKGHFSNMRHKQTLSEFRKMGFDFLIAPADYSTSNIRTFYNFAAKYDPMGMLVSSWEKKNCLRLKSFPVIAYGGRIGTNTQDDDIFEKLVIDMFGSDDQLLVNAVRAFSENKLIKEGFILLEDILSVPYEGIDDGKGKSLELLRYSLKTVLGKVKLQSGKNIINDMIHTIKFQILKIQLKRTTLALFDPELECLNAEKELKRLAESFLKLKKQRSEDWRRNRKNITPNTYEAIYQSAINFIQKLPWLVRNRGVLRVRFCLPDKYSAEQCSIYLKYSGRWKKIKSGCFKNLDSEGAFWEDFILIDKEKAPEAIRFDASGFGGMGIAYVEACYDKNCFVPSKTVRCQGKVLDPNHVLDNDCKWCFIGEKDTIAAFRNRQLASQRHSVEYQFQEW